MVLINCKICKSGTALNHNVKGTEFKNYLCNVCKIKFKAFSEKLNKTETEQLYFKNCLDQNEKDKQNKTQKENQLIPFNYWIVEERQAEKKFLEQQNNKDFLKEQYEKDLIEV